MERELDLNIFYAKKVFALKRQIRNLEKQARKQEQAVISLRWERDRAKAQRDRFIGCVKRVCPHSICLPAQILEGKTPPVYRAHVLNGNDLTSVDFHKVEANVDSLANFTSKIHLRIRNIDTGEVVYYISRKALKVLTASPHSLSYVIRGIVKDLFRLLQKQALVQDSQK